MSVYYNTFANDLNASSIGL